MFFVGFFSISDLYLPNPVARTRWNVKVNNDHPPGDDSSRDLLEISTRWRSLKQPYLKGH